MNLTITPESLRELAETLEVAACASVMSDEGEVILLSRENPEPELAEVYFLRNTERWSEPRWWGTDGWSPDIRLAMPFTSEAIREGFSAAAWGGTEWVRLVEVPF